MSRRTVTQQHASSLDGTGSSNSFEFVAYSPPDPSEPKRAPGRPKGSKSTPGPSNPPPVSEEPQKRRGRPPAEMQHQEDARRAATELGANKTPEAIHAAPVEIMGPSTAPNPPEPLVIPSQLTLQQQPRPFSGSSTDTIQSIALPEVDETGPEAGLAHEGLGEEDEPVGDDDLVDPSFDEARDKSEKRVPRRMPEWLEEEFKGLVAESKLRQQGISVWRKETFTAFLPFEDSSPQGFRGYVPSSQWLRDMYDKFIESHYSSFNKHTAMLSAEICAIDHSFKITKQIAKINGTQMLASLRMYGHAEPAVFYTDNMADKDFLERVFPSLRKDVVAVEKHSNLPTMTIPSDVLVCEPLKSVSEINEAMRSIIQLLPDEETGQYLAIGLDTEYNVDTSTRGYITGRGQTAIIQIACDKRVYILQVGQMVSGKSLPEILRKVLTNPRILKVGSHVTADLAYLQECCGSQTTFKGGINLGAFAKDRLVIKNAKISLEDLCATVLQRCLNKNVSERVSSHWEDADLTTEQIKYAALDAYTSLAIYQALISIPLPSPLPSEPAIHTPVLLFSDDKARLVARGRISMLHNSSEYDKINITPKRCILEILECYVPGAIISTHHKRSLDSFGPTPFNIVCLKSHVRTADSEPIAYSPPSTTQQSLIDTPTPTEDDMTDSTQPELSFEADAPTLGALILDTIDSIVDETSSSNVQSLDEYTEDPQSRQDCNEILGQADPSQTTSFPHIRSRVLKDPFHVFNMFYISVTHGLRIDFSRALRDAIFIPDTSDRDQIIAWGKSQNPPMSWDFMLVTRSRWLWKHCKRIIPPPEQLYPLVEQVFRTYGPLKDSKSGLPLFNSTAWGVAKNILELVRKGHLSDPPGICLYFQTGIDSKAGGLPIYRCFRGTNNTEGGVHRHIIECLPKWGVSIEHVHACLYDWLLRHNLQVGTFNSSGKPYQGHYSIWLTNELQELLTLLLAKGVMPDARLLTGWVNGNLYVPTTEIQGILPIPASVRASCGMEEFDPNTPKQPHHFLASLQQTRKAVLPIHSKEERALFREFIAKNPIHPGSSGEPAWHILVRAWNECAKHRKEISYKLAEHLKLYFNGDWKTTANMKQTLAETEDDRIPLKKALVDTMRSKSVLNVNQAPLRLHEVNQGFLAFADDDDNTMQDDPISETPVVLAIPQQLLGAMSTEESDQLYESMIVESEASGSESRLQSSATLNMATMVSLKRAAELTKVTRPAKRPRQPRRCAKCKSPERNTCPGPKEVALCEGVCKDCKLATCRGRNSSKPNVPCHRAWED
ncbi:hypothetical protein C8J56DRAFT_1051224 [Mycena floridula]|nr:hypothetical protein C8J56DRAFT_1051224 [Mycena floridula]